MLIQKREGTQWEIVRGALSLLAGLSHWAKSGSAPGWTFPSALNFFVLFNLCPSQWAASSLNVSSARLSSREWSKKRKRGRNCETGDKTRLKLNWKWFQRWIRILSRVHYSFHSYGLISRVNNGSFIKCICRWLCLHEPGATVKGDPKKLKPTPFFSNKTFFFWTFFSMKN